MHQKRKTLFLVLVVMALAAGGIGSANAQKTISGTISVDTTLDVVGGAVYQVIGNVIISEGVALTIDPGVTLKFNQSTYLHVIGTLFAEGGDSAANTIVFTSIKDDDAPLGAGEDTNGDGTATSPARGDWHYITFASTTSSASSLRYCTIRYGSSNSSGMIRCITDAAPTFRDCSLSTSNYGFNISGGAAPTIQDCEINLMTSSPIAISLDSNPTFDNIIMDSPSGNGYDAIQIITGSVVDSATLRRPTATVGGIEIPSLPYYVTSNILVGEGETLAIESGVVIKFNNATYLGNSGLLTAIGGATDETRIYFTSINDDNAPDPDGHDTNTNGNATVPIKRAWGGIRFLDTADDLSILENCLVRYAGYNTTSYGAVYCDNADPSLIDCEISLSYVGVDCRGAASPLLRRININGMEDVPIAIEVGCNPEFDAMAFDNNGFSALGLLGGTLTGSNTLRVRGAEISSVWYDNLVYMQIADITVAVTGNLTVDPGVVLKMRSGADIRIDGSFNAIGTADPDSQIVFTSYRDDSFGTPNDTNNDGSTTSPAIANWGTIRYQDSSSGEISHATLRFGATSGYGLISCESASPSLHDLTISETYYGIRQGGTAASVISNVDISNTTYTPVIMSVSADPVFSGINFTNVGLRAIGLVPEVIGVDSVLRVRSMSGYDGITYHMAGDLTIPEGINLRIEPGITWKMHSSYNYDIIVNGSLTADATPDSNIVFTGIQDDAYGNPLDTADDGANSPAANQWGRIIFNSGADDSACILDNCLVAYGSGRNSNQYAVVMCYSSSPTITNNQFISNYHGVWTEGNSNAVIANNSFFNQSQLPLVTSVSSSPQYSGNSFDQNGIHAVGLISETLSADATLEKVSMGGLPSFPYYNLGTTTVGVGTTLTVEPGVIIKARSNSLVFTVNGALQAAGSVGDPIIMTSLKDDSIGGDTNVDGSATSPAAGNWTGIKFTDTIDDANTLVEYCNFRFGGYDFILSMDSASPTIRNNEIELCRYGIRMTNNSNPVVENNLFRVLTYYPIQKSILANPSFSGNVLDNVTYPCIAIKGENIGQDLTLRKYDFGGYTNITQALAVSTLTIQVGATLTIEPGVVLKMFYTTPFSGARINVYGALVADGTPEEPIAFTSIRDDSVGNPSDTNSDGNATLPAVGQWYNIYFDEVSDDALTILDHCNIRYGGNQFPQYGLVYCLSASPTISHCDFSYCEHGISTLGASDPTISDSVFSNFSSTPIRMSLISEPQFSGNQFLSSNKYNALGIHGESLAQDVTIHSLDVAQTANIPYVLLGPVTAGFSSIMRIEPGVIIKGFNSGYNIRIQRGLIAEGGATQDSLIVFTSVADDFYGGDTNNNGSDTIPSSRRWGRILIENEAIDDSTRIKNVVFRYGFNNSSSGTIQITSANPKIDDCTFAYNGTAITYLGTAGDPAKGWIHNSDFLGNTYNAVTSTSTSFTIDATSNWWGHSSGPLDDSDDTGSGGFYNPGGLGDPVSDGIDYGSWDTDGIQNVLLGDVSRNGDIRAYDASLVLQEMVAPGLLGPLQLVLGDVNCSGSPSALDASLILRFVTGIDTYFPCSLDSVATKGQEVLAYAGSEQISFEAHLPEVTMGPEQSQWVAVQLTGNGDLYGQEYHISFDPAQSSVQDVRLLPGIEGVSMAWNVNEGNELRIAMASMEPMEFIDSVEFLVVTNESVDNPETINLLLAYARLNEQEQNSASGVADLPQVLSLYQNHPNPFNPSTTISYSLPNSLGDSPQVRLAIYDLKGRCVKVLVDGPQISGREYHVVWNGRDDHDRRVGSNVYLYRLDTGKQSQIRKMLLLK